MSSQLIYACRSMCMLQTDPTLMPQPLVSNITGTSFSFNRADSNGGALYTLGIWQLSITNSSFYNNSVTTTDQLSDIANSGVLLLKLHMHMAAMAFSPDSTVVYRREPECWLAGLLLLLLRRWCCVHQPPVPVAG